MTERTTAVEPMESAGMRVALFLGADKHLVIGTMGMCAMFALIVRTLWSVGVAAVVWFSVLAVLQRMAKADPFMIRVAIFHLFHKDYYPARSGIHAEPEKVREWRR